MATSRTRSRTRAIVSAGSYSTFNQFGAKIAGPTPGFTGIGDYETCADSTQAYPYITDESLSLVRRRSFPLRLYGREAVPSSTNYWVYEGWNPSQRSSYVFTPNGSVINWPFWMTKALANMNPSKPIVDLPLFLFELKDFPRMLKGLGDILRNGMSPRGVRNLPDHQLAWSFGWAPLISDLTSLLNLQKSIAERIAYLQALERGSRVRRTLFDGEILRTITPNGYTIASGGPTPTLVADVRLTEYLRVWYTAKAKLMTTLPSGSELGDLARGLVLGRTLSAATLWNMIPWSWLIDYFINVSDVLAAGRGYLPFHVTWLNIMASTVTSSSLVRIRYDTGVSSVGGELQTTSKSRFVTANPIPWLTYDPFLTSGQMLNLGSLLTARSLRGIS